MLPLYRDAKVNRFLPWLPIQSRDEMAHYLHHAIFPFYEKPLAYSYAVALRESNRVIGYVHLNDIGEDNGIGYALARAFWNQGIITEACAAVFDRLRKAGLPFITATHDVNNPASGAVMKKLGMTYRYSYRELWQPKNIWVTFRMYQLNLDGKDYTYTAYQKLYPFFIEPAP